MTSVDGGFSTFFFSFSALPNIANINEIYKISYDEKCSKNDTTFITVSTVRTS